MKEKTLNLSDEINYIFVDFAKKILDYGIADVEMEDELRLLKNRIDDAEKEAIKRLKDVLYSKCWSVNKNWEDYEKEIDKIFGEFK